MRGLDPRIHPSSQESFEEDGLPGQAHGNDSSVWYGPGSAKQREERCIAPGTRGSKHLEIFALFPVRDFGLETLDLGVLDANVIVDELRAQRVAEKRIVLQREYRLA
jgi:hypothetical protein